MSLDMFVAAFSEDGENEFPRTLVEQAFAPFVEDVKESHWSLNLKSGEQTSVDLDVEDGEMIDGFSINRPPSYGDFPEFWEALYNVLRQTRAFCVLAGVREDPNCCAANPEAVNEPPEPVMEIAEARGGPRLVSSAAELEAALFD
ncbi:MAG: hypothetical protein AB1508_09265 [Pseudomonadota bacterium]